MDNEERDRLSMCECVCVRVRVCTMQFGVNEMIFEGHGSDFKPKEKQTNKGLIS